MIPVIIFLCVLFLPETLKLLFLSQNKDRQFKCSFSEALSLVAVSNGRTLLTTYLYFDLGALFRKQALYFQCFYLMNSTADHGND